LSLSVLGYAHVPFTANLAISLAAFAALDVWAVRRAGLPRASSFGAIAWPVWIAILVGCVVLVPIFRAGYLTVPGTGSDAHLAVGTAHFLQHHPPTAVAPEE